MVARTTQLVDAVLERAAETLGDITPHVMERYYGRFPEARERFAFHSPENPARLEREMVEQALYCLMRWHSDRGEIEVILDSTIPHHEVALGVASDLFTGMLDALCETIAETIPADAELERGAWTGCTSACRGSWRGACNNPGARLLIRPGAI